MDAPAERPRPKLVEKVEAQRERHLRRSAPLRYATVLVGFLVFVGGIITLVTPGPAFILIPAGLAIMSLEFAWAARLLERSLVEADKAAERARRTTPRQRAITAALTTVAIVVAGLAVWYWAEHGDVWIVPWF